MADKDINDGGRFLPHSPSTEFAGYEEQFSLRPLFRTVWSYRHFIAAVVSGVSIIFAVAALVIYMRQPIERHSGIEFRLIFDGAERSQYPSGVAFGPADIIASPVLSNVYEINDLKRYWTFDQFKNGIYILESSADLELLTLEYQSKLSDTKLTTAERVTLEEQFRQRREALRTPQYKLSFAAPAGSLRVPDALMAKVLNDVLATWADEAATRKGALSYQVRVLSPNILRKDTDNAEGFIVRLDILRSHIDRINANIDSLLDLPGATTTRVDETRISLPEIRANLEDTLRYDLEPLMTAVRVSGIDTAAGPTGRYLDNRLFDVQQRKLQAENTAKALQESLQVYTSARAPIGGQPLGVGDASKPGGVASGLIPQVSESFLTGLVALANDSGDREYRQGLTSQIIQEERKALALNREAAYYQELRRPIGAAGGGVQRSAVTREGIEARLKLINAAVMRAMEQVAHVYAEISLRNLTPRTALYQMTSPFVINTVRGITLRDVALYGVLTLMGTLVLVPLGCIVHHYVRRELSGRVDPRGGGPAAEIDREYPVRL
jgi:hypothetical protein